MKYITVMLLVFAFLAVPLSPAVEAATNPSTLAYSGYPTFSIVSVNRDVSVTIKTRNLPSYDHFRVRMGKMGTRAVKGTVVDTFSSGKGGSKTLTFSIPASLHGKRQIAIRFESTSGSGYFAYNWFYNNTAGTSGKGGKAGYSGFPTFSIVGVVRNTSVTIKAKNLPPNDTFKVLVNYMGTRGVNGVNVGSFSSGTNKTKTMTFDIPAKFKGQRRIAIRFQSTTGSGYFAYNWFYNNTYP